MREENRRIRIYWIYGPTETGKTSLAKELARKENRDYFISGSTRDVFQDYNGEHTIILDELRPKVIPYADLLRITDPYAERVYAPARYHDKCLAADLIIITTPYSPVKFYQDMSVSGMVNKIEDTFWQMERRITLTLFVDQNAFYPAEFDSFKQEYQINTNQKFPNKYSKSARVVQGTSSTAVLFNELMIATNTDEETDTDADTDKDTDTDANTDKESD